VGTVETDDVSTNTDTTAGVASGASAGFVELSGDDYQIQSQDTLWSIANSTKASGVTPHQMMVAVFNANRSAFIGGNINRMINGAVLEIPTEAAQRSVNRSDAFAIVQSWTRGDATFTPAPSTFTADPIPVADTDLEDVNRRLEEARIDLAGETEQRDVLQDRVSSLENSVEETQDAQTAIERKADLDKNVATAEAEAQSIRLSSEEDALRAQLAALEIEKRDLAASSQAEKAELVRLAEVEKTTLLQQARSERERIMAELEEEKARISREAELEVAQVRNEASAENQRVVAEAQEERDRLAAETEAMQSQLAEMEAEKNRLLESAQADEAEEVTRLAADEEQRIVEERLAALDQVPANTDEISAATDTDADGSSTLSNLAGSGKSMVSDGVDKVNGLIGGPLGQGIGDRKTVLGIGAVLSLLGLLGAWAMRRRSRKVDDKRMLSPRADVRRPAPARTNFDDRKTMQDHDDRTRRAPPPNRNNVNRDAPRDRDMNASDSRNSKAGAQPRVQLR